MCTGCVWSAGACVQDVGSPRKSFVCFSRSIKTVEIVYMLGM